MLVLIWRNENENFYFSDFQTFIFFPSGFCLPDTDNLHELVSFSCFVDTFLFSKGLRLYSAADSKWVPLVHEHNSFNKWIVRQWILGNISYYYYCYNYFYYYYYYYYCCHYYYCCDYKYYYYFLNQPNYTILSYSYKINVKYTLYIVQFRTQDWCLSYSRRNCLPIHPIVSKRFRTQMKN